VERVSVTTAAGSAQTTDAPSVEHVTAIATATGGTHEGRTARASSVAEEVLVAAPVIAHRRSSFRCSAFITAMRACIRKSQPSAQLVRMVAAS
jgi:hypothetical protein